MNSIQLTTLNNGITIVHRQVQHTEISHLGIMLDIGSRDELDNEQGLAHFWEHLALKGTQKKNQNNVAFFNSGVLSSQVCQLYSCTQL